MGSSQTVLNSQIDGDVARDEIPRNDIEVGQLETLRAYEIHSESLNRDALGQITSPFGLEDVVFLYERQQVSGVRLRVHDSSGVID
jgi:hypothetical protein